MVFILTTCTHSHAIVYIQSTKVFRLEFPIARSFQTFSSSSLSHSISVVAADTKLNGSMNCETQSSIESNAIGNIISSSASKSPIKDRFVQSPSNQMATTNATIAQPYAGDVSNFGPFYHHHHNHLSAGYGIPYDKFKYPPNSRSPTNSPYTAYQSFYPSNVHHHHHHHRQMVRPNGYIDLVPR